MLREHSHTGPELGQTHASDFSGPFADKTLLDVIRNLAIFLANPYREAQTMTVVNVHEAKTRLSRLLAQVEAGEEVVIARRGNPSPGSFAASRKANGNSAPWRVRWSSTTAFSILFRRKS